MAPTDNVRTITDYSATGLTCGHCVASVIEEVSLIDGVTTVTVDLVVGGASTVRVTGASVPAEADIRAAIDEAGYVLEGAGRQVSAA